MRSANPGEVGRGCKCVGPLKSLSNNCGTADALLAGGADARQPKGRGVRTTLCSKMIDQIKATLAPSLASLGVIAHWKGWDRKAVFFIDKAENWAPELKEFEGGYYEVYRLLSLYKLRPEPAIRDALQKALNRLKEYVPTDFEMAESLDMLQNHASEQFGRASRT